MWLQSHADEDSSALRFERDTGLDEDRAKKFFAIHGEPASDLAVMLVLKRLAGQK